MRGLHEIKTSHPEKQAITKVKRQPTEWEKIFTNYTSDVELIAAIYNEAQELDIKDPTSLGQMS